MGMGLTLVLAKAVQEAWQEFLARVALDRLLDKEMLKVGEQQEPGGGEEQELALPRGRVGEVETGTAS